MSYALQTLWLTKIPSAVLIRKVFMSHPKLFCNVLACCWIASGFHNASSSTTAFGGGSWMRIVLHCSVLPDVTYWQLIDNVLTIFPWKQNRITKIIASISLETSRKS